MVTKNIVNHCEGQGLKKLYILYRLSTIITGDIGPLNMYV